MASHNRIILIGRLAYDPDVRVTNSGDPFVKFQLLVDRPSRDDTPSTMQDKVGIVAWRQLAENPSYKRDDLVLVEGRIQTRSFEDAEGNRKYVTEVEARDIKPFSNAAPSVETQSFPNDAASIQQNTETFVSNDDFDFGDTPSAPAPSNAQADPVMEEDIPF